MHVVSHHLESNNSYDTIKYYKILFQLLNIIVLATHKYNYRTEIYIELKNIYIELKLNQNFSLQLRICILIFFMFSSSHCQSAIRNFLLQLQICISIFFSFISLPECYSQMKIRNSAAVFKCSSTRKEAKIDTPQTSMETPTKFSKIWGNIY